MKNTFVLCVTSAIIGSAFTTYLAGNLTENSAAATMPVANPTAQLARQGRSPDALPVFPPATDVGKAACKR